MNKSSHPVTALLKISVSLSYAIIAFYAIKQAKTFIFPFLHYTWLLAARMSSDPEWQNGIHTSLRKGSFLFSVSY